MGTNQAAIVAVIGSGGEGGSAAPLGGPMGRAVDVNPIVSEGKNVDRVEARLGYENGWARNRSVIRLNIKRRTKGGCSHDTPSVGGTRHGIDRRRSVKHRRGSRSKADGS